MCGPSGIGKPFLLEALGAAVVEAGMRVTWITLESLGALVRRHRIDDTVTKVVGWIVRCDLFVVDGIGLSPVPRDAAEGRYRLVDAAYERRSVAISSNLHPAAACTLRQMRRVGHRLRRAITRWPRPDKYLNPILSEEEANRLIHAIISASRPSLISRFGAVELSCVRSYFLRRQNIRDKPYPGRVVSRMRRNAGFYPPDESSLDAFCRVYLASAAQVDVLGVWHNPFEDVLANTICPSASLVPLRSLEPYYYQDPWSQALAGLKVLVVHPFVESIRENFEKNRARLFADPAVLPCFDLRLVEAVQSIAGHPTSHTTWFDALDYMRARMDSETFDVCIIGAGAYGLPLSAHAKSAGKIAIHLGGATQILFGIKGRRWDNHEISGFYNQWWARPKPTETPEHARSVEGGCYW